MALSKDLFQARWDSWEVLSPFQQEHTFTQFNHNNGVNLSFETFVSFIGVLPIWHGHSPTTAVKYSWLRLINKFSLNCLLTDARSSGTIKPLSETLFCIQLLITEKLTRFSILIRNRKYHHKVQSFWSTHEKHNSPSLIFGSLV